jgi:hypothetical protein
MESSNSQALVVVNHSIPIILALVGTPAVFPRRRHLHGLILHVGAEVGGHAAAAPPSVAKNFRRSM